MVIIRAKNGSGTPFEYNMLPDSGSERSIIPYRIAKTYGWKFERSNEKITAANNTNLSCDGRIDLLIDFQGITADINALISRDLKNDVIISWHDLKKLEILPKNFPNRINAMSHNDDKEINVEKFNELVNSYSDVIKDSLSKDPIGGRKMKLELKRDAQPRKVLTARRLPKHYEEDGKKIIENLLKDGIIEKQTEPSEWLSPGFFVPKDNGKGLRLVVDYSVTGLNDAIKRKVHPFPSSNDIMKNIQADSKYFLKADAVQGYHQLELDEESQKLTSFITPFGCFYYKRAPMGLSGSGDEFCEKTDGAFYGLDGIDKIVDDILVQAPTQSILFHRFEEVLKRCRANGITLSRRKLKIAKENLKFAGFIVGQNGIRPDPEKLDAIAKFPVPTNITSLRSFLGLANQLGGFIPDLAQMTAPIRTLLKKDVEWQWLQVHEDAFQNVKKMLTSDMVIQPFDSKMKTLLLTDASRLNGLGFALMQEDSFGKRKLIQCGSRSLTPAEKNYATIELECLGIQYGVEKSRHFLIGLPSFSVITDHRPLVGIFKKNLDAMDNQRLLRLRLKLIDYNFTVTWLPGKTNYIADALSRNPIFDTSEKSSEEELCSNPNLVCHLQTDPHLADIYDAAESDEDYQLLIQALREDKQLNNLPPSHPAKALKTVWNSLSILDGLILKDDHQIFIPKMARKVILEKLHIPHCGMSKTKTNARQLYYWPRMSTEIDNMTASCPECNENQNSQQKEPMIPTIPTRPLSDIGVDLAHEGGKDFLIMVDAFSGFPFCAKLNSLHTSTVVRQLEDWFLDYSWPDSCRTDGGPQFRSEFNDFCTRNGIKHDPSSPYNPISNGLAENGVKTCKKLLKKSHSKWYEFKKALHAFRNTPRVDGFSPSQMLFGRRQKDSLPCLPSAYDPIDVKSASEGRRLMKEKQKMEYDKHAKEMSKLDIGTSVLIQNPYNRQWDQSGIVVSMRENGRSYEVENDGKIYLRNRRFLRENKIVEKLNSTDEESAEETKGILRRSERLKSKKSVSINTHKNTIQIFE